MTLPDRGLGILAERPLLPPAVTFHRIPPAIVPDTAATTKAPVRHTSPTNSTGTPPTTTPVVPPIPSLGPRTPFHPRLQVRLGRRLDPPLKGCSVFGEYFQLHPKSPGRQDTSDITLALAGSRRSAHTPASSDEIPAASAEGNEGPSYLRMPRIPLLSGLLALPTLFRLSLGLSWLAVLPAWTLSDEPPPLFRIAENPNPLFIGGISPEGRVVWQGSSEQGPWRAYQSRPGAKPEMIVQFDAQIPDRPKLTFSRLSFDSWPGPGGRVLFRTQVGPLGEDFRKGLFLYQSNRISTVAIGGEPVPGESNLWFTVSLNIIAIPTFATNGDCALRLPVTANPSDQLGRDAILAVSEGRVRMILRDGMPLPGDPSTPVNHLQSIHMTPQMGILIMANLQSPISDWECLWQLQGSHLAPLIQFDRRLNRGTPAPGTAGRRFAYCGLGPQTAANGNIAFTADTMAAGEEYGATLEGLWNGLPGQLELRVQLGDPFDGLLSGTLTRFFGEPVPASNNSVAFTGWYETKDNPEPQFGIFLSRRSGSLELVLHGGMPAPGLDVRWRVQPNLFHVVSSFGAGEFLVVCLVGAEGEFSKQAFLVLDEQGRVRPIAYQGIPIVETRTGDAISGFLTMLAGWENGLGQRRLVSDDGLMLLPIFGTTINGSRPRQDSIYIAQLLGGASRLATVPDPSDPSKVVVSAQVEPGKTYRWEHAQTLSGPWTKGSWIWPEETVPPQLLVPVDASEFFRLVSP